MGQKIPTHTGARHTAGHPTTQHRTQPQNNRATQPHTQGTPHSTAADGAHTQRERLYTIVHLYVLR